MAKMTFKLPEETIRKMEALGSYYDAVTSAVLEEGVTQLRKPEEEVLLTPLGELMDQWELHKQFLGIAKPKREVFIEDIIPEGI